MIRVYSLVLLFGAVRQNCEIGLERNLTYQPLAVVGLAETLFRRVLILLLAVTGAGAWSFIWGNVVAFFAATVAIRQISGTPLGFAFDRHLTMDLIRNGLAFRLHLVGGRLRRLATLTLVTRIPGTGCRRLHEVGPGHRGSIPAPGAERHPCCLESFLPPPG